MRHPTYFNKDSDVLDLLLGYSENCSRFVFIHLNRVSDEQRVLSALVVFRLIVYQVRKANAHLEYHSGFSRLRAFVRDEEIRLAEFDAS